MNSKEAGRERAAKIAKDLEAIKLNEILKALKPGEEYQILIRGVNMYFIKEQDGGVLCKALA